MAKKTLRDESFRGRTVSTGHMTKSDEEQLTRIVLSSDVAPVLIAKYDYGFFVSVSRSEDDGCDWDNVTTLGDMGFSPDFIKVCRAIQAAGYDFARFDSDGPVDDRFATHTW